MLQEIARLEQEAAYWRGRAEEAEKKLKERESRFEKYFEKMHFSDSKDFTAIDGE